MRKLLLFVILTCILAACTKDETPQLPSVRFSSAQMAYIGQSEDGNYNNLLILYYGDEEKTMQFDLWSDEDGIPTGTFTLADEEADHVFTGENSGVYEAVEGGDPEKLYAFESGTKITICPLNCGGETTYIVRIHGKYNGEEFIGTYRGAILSLASLSTSPETNNTHNGIMFDLVAKTNITVTGFDVNAQSSGTLEIYYRQGGYSGYEQNAGAWTLLGSASVIASGGIIPIPLGLSVPMSTGDRYGFYITFTASGVDVNYYNGNTEGETIASDPQLDITGGRGVAYPFGTNFTPRSFSGTVHYTF